MIKYRVSHISRCPGHTNGIYQKVASRNTMVLFRKSILKGCFKSKHVTKRGLFMLATIRYVNLIFFCQIAQ